MRDDHDSLTADLFADMTHQAQETGPQAATPLQTETYSSPPDARTAQNSANGDELQQRAQQHAEEVAKTYSSYKLINLHTHRLADGTVSHWVMRLKNGKGVKRLLPFAPLAHFTPDRLAELQAEQAEKLNKTPRAKPFICADGFINREPCYQLVYPAGNGKKPLYALDRISTAPAGQPVWFLEGQQKADAVNLMGGYATTGGACSSISNLDLSPLADRHVIIWPDHDAAGHKMADELSPLLHAMGCTVEWIATEPLELPDRGDIVDWISARNEKGLNTTLDNVQTLQRNAYTPNPKIATAGGSSDDDSKPKARMQPLAEAMYFNGGRFEILPNGIWYISEKDDSEQKIWISSPIVVLAKTRDGTSNDWGRLLQWHDDALIRHEWAVSMELFQTDGADLRKALANMGVIIATGRYERSLFQTYLASYPVDQLAICVSRVGWHGQQYVLPNKVIGKNAGGEIVVYQSSQSAINKYTSSGTLADWQQRVSQRIEPHSYLVLAISAAFAGQLIEPLGMSGGIIHFKGGSSKGKSSAIFTACSVWGAPKTYYHTWRQTSNALEQTAYVHNDGLLVLDEIGEIPNPAELGSVVYMLINGKGKGRMTKTLSIREASQWRLVALSSGEKTLNELMGERGQKAKLGQEIRLLNIDIDHSPHGVFDAVTFADTAAQQAVMLNAAINQVYGTAGMAWLEYLTNDKLQHASTARQLIDQYAQQLTSHQQQGHIERVAQYFAMIAAAGEMATTAGITGWQTGRAFEAVQQVFDRWLASFAYTGDFEAIGILEQIKAFFIAHGSSRFEPMDQPIMRNAAGDDITPRIHNRVGYFKHEPDGKKYIVDPVMFKQEICQSIDEKRAAKILKQYGWLEYDNEYGKDRSSKKIITPETGGKRTRHYCFKESAILSFDADLLKNQGGAGGKGGRLEPSGLDAAPPQKIAGGAGGNSTKDNTADENIAKICPTAPPVEKMGGASKPFIHKAAPPAPSAPPKKTTFAQSGKSDTQLPAGVIHDPVNNKVAI